VFSVATFYNGFAVFYFFCCYYYNLHDIFKNRPKITISVSLSEETIYTWKRFWSYLN